MKKECQLPSHALVVTEYDEFSALVQAFVDGHHELMTIIGNAGVGKTEEVKRRMRATAGHKWTLLKGKHSPLDLYRKLYESRLFPVVLDDLDGLFKSPDNTAVLKCLCDTVPVKRVEWGSTHAAFERADNPLPKAFDSISRACVIANDWQTVNRNLAALQDRGVLAFFRPSPLEVHRQIAQAGWFDDPEVFDFVGRNLFLITKPSFRFYITGKNHKKSGLDWRNLLLRTMESDADPKLILVARLLADSSFDHLPAREKAREIAFSQMGGGSRATYHRYKQVLIERRGNYDVNGVQGIKLAPPRVDQFSLAMAERRNQLEAMRDEANDPWSFDDGHPNPSDGDNPAESHPGVVDHFATAVEELRRRMQQAVATESYEIAARLRDTINHLEGLGAATSCDETS